MSGFFKENLPADQRGQVNLAEDQLFMLRKEREKMEREQQMYEDYANQLRKGQPGNQAQQSTNRTITEPFYQYHQIEVSKNEYDSMTQNLDTELKYGIYDEIIRHQSLKAHVIQLQLKEYDISTAMVVYHLNELKQYFTVLYDEHKNEIVKQIIGGEPDEKAVQQLALQLQHQDPISPFNFEQLQYKTTFKEQFDALKELLTVNKLKFVNDQDEQKQLLNQQIKIFINFNKEFSLNIKETLVAVQLDTEMQQIQLYDASGTLTINPKQTFDVIKVKLQSRQIQPQIETITEQYLVEKLYIDNILRILIFLNAALTSIFGDQDTMDTAAYSMICQKNIPEDKQDQELQILIEQLKLINNELKGYPNIIQLLLIIFTGIFGFQIYIHEMYILAFLIEHWCRQNEFDI